jgi:hypothetical protein
VMASKVSVGGLICRQAAWMLAAELAMTYLALGSVGYLYVSIYRKFNFSIFFWLSPSLILRIRNIIHIG